MSGWAVSLWCLAEYCIRALRGCDWLGDVPHPQLIEQSHRCTVLEPNALEKGGAKQTEKETGR
jgi:hypothetical protein